MDLAGPPRGPVYVPAVVRELAGDREVRPIWRNKLGGVTFAVGEERYVKWQDPDVAVDLGAEAERLEWLALHTPVPKVLDEGADGSGHWLVTTAIAGGSAVAPRWVQDPRPAVVAIGEGLRRFHDAVPVDRCPFDWSVERRVALDPPGVIVPPAPPIDHLVVCHGDACAPNTLVVDDGSFAAHVDVGQAGVADRWADLAVASWSLDWNFGPGWDAAFFEAYGVEADPERIAFYRLLWGR